MNDHRVCKTTEKEKDIFEAFKGQKQQAAWLWKQATIFSQNVDYPQKLSEKARQFATGTIQFQLQFVFFATVIFVLIKKATDRVVNEQQSNTGPPLALEGLLFWLVGTRLDLQKTSSDYFKINHKMFLFLQRIISMLLHLSNQGTRILKGRELLKAKVYESYVLSLIRISREVKGEFKLKPLLRDM